MNDTDKLRSKRSIAFFLTGLTVFLTFTSCLPTKSQVANSIVTITPNTSSTNGETATPVATIGQEGNVIIFTPESGASGSARVTLFSNFDVNLTPTFDPSLRNLINLSNTQAFFDFDKGEITNSNSADIYMAVSCGTACFNIFLTINGATAVVNVPPIEIRNEPSYEGCQKELREHPTNVFGISQGLGDYSCLRTNEGNVVQILAVDNEPHAINSRFTFDYHLWYPSPTP